MTRRRTDWAADRARQIVALTANLSADVAVNYIASELRVAHQRGGIEATKANGAKPKAEKDGLL